MQDFEGFGGGIDVLVGVFGGLRSAGRGVVGGGVGSWFGGADVEAEEGKDFEGAREIHGYAFGAAFFVGR